MKTYMDPSQGDKAILILDQEELFFVLSVTIVRAPILLGDNDVGYCEFIPHLGEKTK